MLYSRALTVNWTDWDAPLDEGLVYVQHHENGNSVCANPDLGQLKGDRTICVAAKDSSASCVLVLLEGKVLAPCQPWISQQLPKHLVTVCWSLEQPDILFPVTILLQIDDFQVTFLYRCHQPLVHVVIHVIWMWLGGVVLFG